MAIQYDLSAVDIIRLLGCTEPVDRGDWEDLRKKYSCSLPMDKTRLECFEETYDKKMPPQLYEFLNLANDNPLFETADIWAAGPCSLYFLYEEIEEGIEEDKEYWEEAPEDCEDNEYFPFSQIPKEQWKDLVQNYLEIGSDYAAGVVSFGICETDLDKDNPPVYMLHEADSIKDWKIISDTLADFLVSIVGDMLAGVMYQTAQDILEEGGWEIRESEYGSQTQLQQDLAQQQIDLFAMKKYASFYGTDAFYRFCADKDAGRLFLIKDDKSYMVFEKAE